ncbi:MAG TPA: peptidoglycan-associated lipoprotein Pal [Chakrabartia sp.]|nr:peptidoglycan-associated lipoprotein Pal [Chakrabartia sp.]
MAGKMMIAATVAALALAGCANKPKRLPPVADGTPGGNGSVTDPNGGIILGTHQDFIRSVMSDRVFFDTDRYNIDSEDMAALQSQAQWLARYPNTRATIEGHCDERGTRDYNLALGERRANAAKNALVSMGVNPARVTTVSYGKERPDALGSDAESWARNRRAVTVTVR